VSHRHLNETQLKETQRLPTSGARAVEPFELDGRSYLAIPQLSSDAPGTPPGMNGGNSDTDLLLFRREEDGYAEYQRLPVPGGEDAEFFRIGDQAFLATASIRRGHGPYEYKTDSMIYAWSGDRFMPFQAVPTFAAKQWKHFAIGDRHFLALAQGVALPHTEHDNRPSIIFEWNGQAFRPFQEIPSRWAYNWHFFELAGQHFLAHADNVDPSRLYRWDGQSFVEHQTLVEAEGRAFATFAVDDETYLACAVIGADSLLLRWDGERFAPHQVLESTGGREFALLRNGNGLYLIRINFITGTRENPNTALNSQIYRWEDGRFGVVSEFPTFGGTDVAVYAEGDETRVAVSNSLTADVHFSTDTIIYTFTS
jgi:EPTP domain